MFLQSVSKREDVQEKGANREDEKTNKKNLQREVGT
jgi:hypothetical protein